MTSSQTKILLLLLIFFGLLTLPVWHSAITGKAERPRIGGNEELLLSGQACEEAPDCLVPPIRGRQCVEPGDYMAGSHMDLLNSWRDDVVRERQKYYIPFDNVECAPPGVRGADGKCRYEMSLTDTCLSCHNNKAAFCDRCHHYVGENPYCFDCHIDTTVRTAGR